MSVVPALRADVLRGGQSPIGLQKTRPELPAAAESVSTFLQCPGSSQGTAPRGQVALLWDLLFVTLGVGECGPSGRTPPPTAAQCLTVHGACPGEGAVGAASDPGENRACVLCALCLFSGACGQGAARPHACLGERCLRCGPTTLPERLGHGRAGRTLGQRHCGQSAGDAPALQLACGKSLNLSVP